MYGWKEAEAFTYWIYSFQIMCPYFVKQSVEHMCGRRRVISYLENALGYV